MTRKNDKNTCRAGNFHAGGLFFLIGMLAEF